MSKALAAAAALAATTTAVAVPTVLLKKGNTTGENPPSPTEETQKFEEPNWTHKKIPRLTSSGDIQTNFDNIKCLKTNFESIDWKEGSVSKTEPNSVTSFVSDNKQKGCLTVEYYKQQYQGGKWWGEFRLLWSLKDETKGLVTVVNVKTEEGKLKGNSIAYLLEKENGNGWVAKNLKENEIKELKNETEISKLIPKAGDAIKAEEYKSHYWGLEIKNENICGTSDCKNKSGNPIEKSVTWNLSCDRCSITAKIWCNDLDTWFNTNFGWDEVSKAILNLNGDWVLAADQ